MLHLNMEVSSNTTSVCYVNTTSVCYVNTTSVCYVNTTGAKPTRSTRIHLSGDQAIRRNPDALLKVADKCAEPQKSARV